MLWGAYRLRAILTPFALAFAIAYFLNPVANGLERLFSRLPSRLRWIAPRAAAVGTLIVAVILAMGIIALVVIPTVYQQVTDTAAKVPGYVQTIRAKVEPAIQRLNLRYPGEIEELRVRIEETVRKHLPEIVAPIPGVVGVAFSSALAFVLTVLNLLVIPVFATYLLYDMNRICDGIAALVPHRYRDYVYSRTRSVDALLAAFVRGQITVCLILGSFYGVAMTLCGVPMGLLVGFVIGFFNLVPFMSTLIGLPLALLLSWLDDQSLRALIAVTGVFIFGHLVESNFITPRIVGERLGLHAVIIMLAVLIGGTLFGFVGMLVAVPVTAALSVFWTDLRALYLDSDFFKGGGGRGGGGSEGAAV